MKTALAAVSLAVLLGCATRPSSEQSRSNDADTARMEIASSRPAAAPGAAASLVQTEQRTIENLTLSQALELAENAHPDLAAGRARIAEAEGLALQAGLFPNPEFGAGAEEVRFSGRSSAQAEYTAGVSQPIPLSKRLSAARRVEVLEGDRLSLELQSKRLEIRMRVQSAFADALYWQQVIEAWEGAVQIAENGLAISRARVDAGDAIPTEAGQATIEVRRAQLELERARSNRVQVNETLGAAIGDPSLRAVSVDVSLDNIELEAPAIDSLVTRLDQSPSLASARAAVAVHEARIHLAEEEAKPDINLDLFYRRIGDDTNSADLGFRIPIPLFDRNQGAIKAARAALAASEAEARSLRNELNLDVRNSHRRLVRAIDSANLLRKDILPQAQSVLDGFETRYAEGDVSLTEILPVRRDATTLRLNYLDALRDVMQTWAQLSPYYP